MKTNISILLTLLLFSECRSQESFVCRSQESFVELKGGYDSLYKAIKHETLLPDSCGQTGKVFVDFVISELGNTKEASVVKGICPTADSIALNIVKRLKYTPAKRNGLPISVKQFLPIYFTKKE